METPTASLMQARSFLNAFQNHHPSLPPCQLGDFKTGLVFLSLVKYILIEVNLA